MTEEIMPLNFASSADRDAWITKHAEYYSVCHRRNGSNNPVRCNTWAEVKPAVQKVIEKYPEARCLIYSVYRIYQGYVGTMSARDL